MLSAGFLGLLDAIGEDFFGSSGNSPFKTFSSNSEALSISAEKLNLSGLMDRGETVRLKEKLGRASSLSLNFVWGSLALKI